jgi:hypothetical protein
LDHVVYLIGAGFSAPLGLPVMSNFLIKSKDLYFSDSTKYEHFREIFSTIERLSVTKNYFEADLFNIEEVLSILEMQEQLEGSHLKEQYIKYIADTILHFTPRIYGYDGSLPGNWQEFVFGKDANWRGFGSFVASLQSIAIEQRTMDSGREREFCSRALNPQSHHYDVISLNYDLVLENVCRFIYSHFPSSSVLRFIRSQAGVNSEESSPWLCKLHGSADGQIVPPTWSKALNPSIEEQWKKAHQLLATANHIRILGYSLPSADAYVKFLLKSSVVQAQHLKSIDVIVLDPEDTVRRRYDEFVSFKYYRFANASIEDYIKRIQEVSLGGSHTRPYVEFNALEQVHEAFMRERS